MHLEEDYLFRRHIPHVDAAFLRTMDSLSIRDLAYSLLQPFVSDDLSDGQLSAVIEHTFQFDIPVKKLVGIRHSCFELISRTYMGI